MKEQKGRIFNIQKYSIHDGDGVRTLVFFKGCPLSCKWCSNPEGISYKFEVMKNHDACITCGKCAQVCPRAIHKQKTDLTGKMTHFIDRKLICSGCRLCEGACSHKALEIAGQDKTIKQILDVLLQDALFYLSSGGGITLGGGEVTAQGEFAVNLLKEAKMEGLNTAIETCGYTSQKVIENFAQYTDLFLFDLKVMNSDRHQHLVGVRNERVLANLEYLLERGSRVSIRIPLIKGLNDSHEELSMVMDYIKRISDGKDNLNSVDILPYHKLGVAKYEKLDLTYPLLHQDLSYTDGELDRIVKFLATTGLPVKLMKH